MTASTSIDGLQLKGMFIAGSNWLKTHEDYVNALNVFPVPDGDTGTNMVLTLQAAMQSVHAYTGSHAGDLAAVAAQGALMGARGNSGVILSQILSGFGEAFADKENFTRSEFALALQIASNKAYNAVINPVEGTILTVIKETALTGRQLARQRGKFTEFLARLLATAQHTLRLTPELLPALKEAGVVDSGGQGLVYFLEGMLRYVKGLPVAEKQIDKWANGQIDKIHKLADLPAYGYDVQFLISGTNLQTEAIQKRIAEMGQYPLVVGNAQLLRIHLHTPDPGLPLSYGVTQGNLLDIVVENLDEQSRRFTRAQTAKAKDTSDIALVCAAPSPELAKIFKSLGATLTIGKGRTPLPGAQDFLQAIQQVNANKILLLPNNKNIIMTAQQAGSLAEKTVQVLPSETIPQGISAALAFNPEADVKFNVAQMLHALRQVQTIEITQAARSVKLNGLQVRRGDIIGLLNNTLTAVGSNINQVALDMLAQQDIGNIEIISIYYGQDASAETANALANSITAAYAHLSTEVIYGGQAHNHYIISLE